MKKLLFMFAAVSVLFTACNKDCGHEFIEHDFTKDLVGTWTNFGDGGIAEAMVIKEDGSFTTTGIAKGGSLYEEKGTIKVVNNKVTLVFDGDNETFEGRLELVSGKSLSIVINEEYDIRLTYDYCKNDLADEIVGMWVCNNGEDGMLIRTFSDDGKVVFTGFSPLENGNSLNKVDKYKVIGNLMYIYSDINENPTCIVSRIAYTPNATELGDIMINYVYLPTGELVEKNTSWLRIKQSLNFTGNTYNYSSAYVTNAKGVDEDFYIMGYPFNMAKIKASDLDMILGANLFCVELNANSIKHKYRPNGQDEEFDAPISVEGNKVTLDMSAVNPALRKVEMHMFQDADDTQLHMYMHTDAFINYFANLEVVTLIAEGKINKTDDAAIAKVFADMEARIESINVSFVLRARK